MNRSIAQAIVDEVESAGLFLADTQGEELFFATSGYPIEEIDLDEVYDLASMYAAVTVYEAYHQGEDMIVVEILN